MALPQDKGIIVSEPATSRSNWINPFCWLHWTWHQSRVPTLILLLQQLSLPDPTLLSPSLKVWATPTNGNTLCWVPAWRGQHFVFISHSLRHRTSPNWPPMYLGSTTRGIDPGTANSHSCLPSSIPNTLCPHGHGAQGGYRASPGWANMETKSWLTGRSDVCFWGLWSERPRQGACAHQKCLRALVRPGGTRVCFSRQKWSSMFAIIPALGLNGIKARVQSNK